jgi:3-dehydroquinate dehydratase/shikimate dehydrogenase
MICVVIPGPTLNDARAQINASIGTADLIELRLDLFTSIEWVSLLRNEFSIPMIFTIKGQKIETLPAVAPEFIDIEHTTPLALVEKLLEKFPATKIIVSYHNFHETPLDLDSLFYSMQRKGASFYKIACMAHSTTDALRLLSWACGKTPRVIPVSMGQNGTISRIISPLRGSPFTYACVDGHTTAPGQIAVATHHRLYRVGPHTLIFGLIGNPVDKSVSHATHNHLIRESGLEAVYTKMRVTKEELPSFLDLAKKLKMRGLSVTMPLKEAILPFIDEIDPAAKAIGAVNTLLLDSGRIYGYNTDGIGCMNAIEEITAVRGKKVVIIGAGGAAKAIAYEAHRRGALLSILNRDAAKANEIALRLNGTGGSLDQMKDRCEEGYEILINSTPLPLPIDPAHIRSHTIVMDIATIPTGYGLMEEAAKRHCLLVPGYKMFVEQAIRQFEIWFPNKISRIHIKSILEKKVVDFLKI